MLSGFLPGFLNGLLGTGGGILAVTALKKLDCSPNEAHATALGLMLPLSAITLLFCFFQRNVDLLSYWPFLFPAVGGSFAGARLLKRIQPRKLRLLFALLILYSAIHILTR